MNRILALAVLTALLAGCGAQGFIGPVLSSGVLGGGSSSVTSLTLHIDQAHGDITIAPSALPPLLVPSPTPAPVPVPVPTPAPVPPPPPVTGPGGPVVTPSLR